MRTRFALAWALALILGSVSTRAEPFPDSTAADAASGPQAQERRAQERRTVVWLQPNDEVFLERIEGQTNDLAVELVEAREILPPDRAGQLRAARHLAERHRARAVVWMSGTVEPVDEGAQPVWVLCVALPGEDRLLERQLGGGAAPGSATLEAAALVVRESLQAMAVGETVGSPAHGRFEDLPEGSDQLVPDAGPPVLVPAPPSLPTPRVFLVPTQNPGSRAGLHDEGWEVAAAFGLLLGPTRKPEGTTGSPISEQVLGRLSHGWPTFDLFGVLAAGLPEQRSHSGFGTFSVIRQHFALGAAGKLSRDPVSAKVGLRAGGALYTRYTTRTVGAVRKEPARVTPAATLGPEVRLSYPGGPTRLRLDLTVAADLVLHGPSIGYEVNGDFEEVRPAPVVEPQIGLGLAFPIRRRAREKQLPSP